MTEPRRKPGRPPSADGPRIDHIVTLSADERAEIDAAAERAGMPRATYIREAALRAARRTVGRPVGTEGRKRGNR